MRIQHNIMAMSAYRNYNTNTSAVAKNLEKLSSGYKINRAGDDAAGLAISEKMRAQITGLNAAQKNVKDGISLVKTAEGAMQEIQDMLNRMDYLATQSANGTYQDAVDREALQKEVNQLLDEINRIADSANFNGIKLLDGSLENGAGDVTAYSSLPIAPAVEDNATADVGTGTIVHTDSVKAGTTKFSVDLNNAGFAISADGNATGVIKLSMTGSDGSTFELELDETDLTTAGGTAGEAVSADIIAKAFKAKAGDDFTIKEQGFSVEVGGAGNNQLIFTQKATPNNADEVVTGKWKVSLTGTGANAAAGETKAPEFAENTGNTDKKLADFGIASIDFGDLEVADGTEVKASYNYMDGYIFVKVGEKIFRGAEGAAGDTITLEEVDAATGTANKVANGATISVTNAADLGTTRDADIAEVKIGTFAAPAGDASVTGKTDYNASSEEITQGAAAASGRLASTYINQSDLKIKDGSALKVGNKTYVFQVGADSKVSADGAVAVNLKHLTGNESDFINQALTELTKTAEMDGNDMFSIGYDNGRLTFTEQDTYQTTAGEKAVDLSTRDAIAKQFGFAADGRVSGKALSLQLGDTSDSYNQLKVSIGNMHATALGINGLNIGTAEDASASINIIKNAINQVSSVRGDLGAYQNRLEHTANNLSVMAENITDAESSIRDTDIAEEMMSYTKNNILVQSAQAMLAQANQVPQGVLQLLG